MSLRTDDIIGAQPKRHFKTMQGTTKIVQDNDIFLTGEIPGQRYPQPYARKQPEIPPYLAKEYGIRSAQQKDSLDIFRDEQRRKPVLDERYEKNARMFYVGEISQANFNTQNSPAVPRGGPMVQNMSYQRNLEMFYEGESNMGNDYQSNLDNFYRGLTPAVPRDAQTVKRELETIFSRHRSQENNGRLIAQPDPNSLRKMYGYNIIANEPYRYAPPLPNQSPQIARPQNEQVKYGYNADQFYGVQATPQRNQRDINATPGRRRPYF
eukprot:TRINITY_DN9156_c0_g1_i2.p1 TRINITY_DN9156_c0_g1~~TRINITY_DN9156_c0_g1_i2.p1  ORF type:complete len:266 (-),score=48.83 TRINITY_DN9156_c0_g1_i2:91-888(-)